MHWLIIICYLSCLMFVLCYSIAQFNTTILYIKAKKKKAKKTPPPLVQFPFVTIQLPVYNEKYVIERLIDTILAFDYPTDKFEIQLLDDSTDETTQIIEDKIRQVSTSVPIYHIRREERIDYKAGALKHGLKSSKGEFIAIFDADFTPPTDFLVKTIPYFQDQEVGVVQTRWGHLNEDYSILTKLQSYALNAHFTVDQLGRNANEHYINFNGTAGVWRLSTIEDAGGWEGDTLTEDLDLSYRAQLNKWKFVYLEDVVSPAELPAEMNALKSQQFRWAKGAAECTRKNLGKVLKASDVKWSTKLHSIFHLLNSFNWVCLFVSASLLLPFQLIVIGHPQTQYFLGFMIIFHISFYLLFLYYFIANCYCKKRSILDYIIFIVSYPAFLTISMGISLYNTIGVLEGYFGKRSSFVRTPKFNIVNAQDGIKSKSYVSMKITWITLLETLGVFYFGYTCWVTWQVENYMALPFTFMMFLGLIIVLFFSTFHYYRAKN